MTDELHLDPTRTALLVMDYQTSLVPRFPDPEALLARVNTAIADVRALGVNVAWVRTGFDDADFDAIPPTSMFARFASIERRPEVHADAPGTQIHDSLSPQPHDITVDKTRVSAFSTTDLEQQLRDR